jgi:hypothetical protein
MSSVATFCPQCGERGVPGDRFCGACGELLVLDVPATEEPDTVAIPAQRTVPRSAADIPYTLPGWMRTIPPAMWAGCALAVVVFFVGFGMVGANQDTAEACTISSYGRFSLVTDTPECDAAIEDRDLGRTLMGGGGVVAVAIPVSAFSRRRAASS